MNKQIKIKNAVVSFANLAQPSSYEGKPNKYDLTMLIDKDSETAKLIVLEVQSMLLENENKQLWYEENQLALKNGDNSDYQGNHGNWVLKANSGPQVVCLNTNKAKMSLDEIQASIVKGATVNALVTLWYQNNQYGQRVNCILNAVQFAKESQTATKDFESFFSELDDSQQHF